MTKPSHIWDRILTENDGERLEYTERQVYALWQHINEEVWRLDEDQVKSARKVLEAVNGKEVDIIEVTEESGIDVIAFALKEPVDAFGGETAELAMDSTWKTNAASYELYAIVGEANGQALPMGFIFTKMTDGSAAKGAKERMLTQVLEWFKKRCPNIQFTLSDKDPSEMRAFRNVFLLAKHQLCYWHAVKYIEERLTQNKPPAAYDPRKAHAIFKFIDPTWAPGITRGDVEEYLDGRDVEQDGGQQGGVREHLQAQRNKEIATTLPPVFVIRAGEKRLPIWPDPPPPEKSDLPEFCPSKHRPVILEKFCIHLHQHPAIPFNDADGTHLTPDEIHEGATSDMYHYCYKHDMSQVWAYLWSRWYSPAQWQLWARAPAGDIPRLKTTMIVEATWRVIKHQDLRMFNRPRIDLVVHLLITKVRNRTRLLLDTLLQKRRQGRGCELAPWQKALRAEWLDMSKPDEMRHIERELTELYKPANTQGRAERLAWIREQAERPAGLYHTDIRQWTCSCPSFLISRFLLCKHLVRSANTHLKLDTKKNLAFFGQLRRHHRTPFYHLPGLHVSLPAPQAMSEPLQPKKILRYPGQDIECRTEECTADNSTSARDKTGQVQQQMRHQHTDIPQSDQDVSKQVIRAVRVEESGEVIQPECEPSSNPEAPDAELDVDTDPAENKVFFTEADKILLKRNFDAMLEAASGPIHPKLAKQLGGVFNGVNRVGGDIHADKAAKRSRRTWSDSTPATMYLP